MPYALCILGCGTMGISVLSGVLDNLTSPLLTNSNDEESAPSTPMGSMILEDKVDSVPDRYALCLRLTRDGADEVAQVYRDG